jgi:hypothetical protein
MSGNGQTTARVARTDGRQLGDSRVDLLLYGLNEAGEPVLAERLPAERRSDIHLVAAERLASHHAVEVWEGPTCILRLRGGPTGGGAG